MSNQPRVPGRPRPVIAQMLLGRRNREIARTCALTEHTVENYVSEILELCGCPSRAAFVARALAGEFGDLEEVSP